MRVELYQARLKELGWTKYRLAQEIVTIRQRRGEDVTFRSIESAIRRALANPDTASAQTNDDIVEAMGGETVIRWKTMKEVKL
jgi:hypothetical protein